MAERTERPPAQYFSHVLGGALRDAQERQLLARVRQGPIPRHLAIIMDGNRRFAKEVGIGVADGHHEGKNKLEQLLDWCLEIDLRILTVYAFSTENARRSEEELRGLIRLFVDSFREIADDARVHTHHIRVRAIGNRSFLPSELVEAIEQAEARTKDYTDYLYNVAIGYGGREEIVHAIQELAREVQAGKLTPEQIDDKLVSTHLYTADLPDPDFVLRTSGEERISNFLLWQTAYSELYFSDVFWPGLTKLEFLRAINSFQRRQRRYGR